MIRRFNYTQRRRIVRESIAITLHQHEGRPPTFDAELDFDPDLGLPGDARVFIEGYRQSLWMRFDFGTVERLDPPGDRELSRFAPGQQVIFRVKVVESNGGVPRLLAWANQVQPMTTEEQQAGRRSLLPVELVDLGSRLWRLAWEADQPVLQLNRDFRQPRELSSIAHSDADFKALVFPEVVRLVLTKLVLGESAPDETGDGIDVAWVRFAAKNLQTGPLPARITSDGEDFGPESESYSEIEAWIDRAVDNFCRQQRVPSLYEDAKSRENHDS